jgi:hypothetical protein
VAFATAIIIVRRHIREGSKRYLGPETSGTPNLDHAPSAGVFEYDQVTSPHWASVMTPWQTPPHRTQTWRGDALAFPSHTTAASRLTSGYGYWPIFVAAVEAASDRAAPSQRRSGRCSSEGQSDCEHPLPFPGAECSPDNCRNPALDDRACRNTEGQRLAAASALTLRLVHGLGQYSKRSFPVPLALLNASASDSSSEELLTDIQQARGFVSSEACTNRPLRFLESVCRVSDLCLAQMLVEP